MASPDFASAAFRLALRRLYVFRLQPGTKVPLPGSRGHLDASDDADLARLWWQQMPAANIATATGVRSKIWVLDVDPKNGGDETLAELEAQHGALPLTVRVQTPSGGEHLWWQWPANGPEIRCSASRVGPGLDVRAEGGFVVVPPSRLANGRGYRWIANGARAIADAPAWLIHLTQPPPPPPRAEPGPPPADLERYVSRAVREEFAKLESASAGTRNVALNGAAFNLAQFVKAGALPEDWARQQLEARALAIGLPAREVQHTINSAFRAAEPRELPR